MTSTSHKKQITEDMVEQMLHHIHTRFYADSKTFYRDRKMLLYSITWSAKWLSQRGLSTSKDKYQSLIFEILQNVLTHGKVDNYQTYFPRYLLKSIQNHLIHNEDKLYTELKHIRNYLQSVLQNHNIRQQYDENEQMIQVLTQVHSITKPSKSKKLASNNPKQMLLF